MAALQLGRTKIDELMNSRLQRGEIDGWGEDHDGEYHGDRWCAGLSAAEPSPSWHDARLPRVPEVKPLFRLGDLPIFDGMASALYPATSEEPLRRLAQAADIRLQGQLTAALAADQRAMVFSGLLAAATAALGGAAATVLTGNAIDHRLGELALLAAAGTLFAMILAVIAARPTAWFFPGSTPSDWIDDFQSSKPEIDRLQELLCDYDYRIGNNIKTMTANGRWLMSSTIVVIVDLVITGSLMFAHIYSWL